MPRKKAGFKCPKCGQSFGLAMHLGRHMSAKHGQAPTGAGKRAKAKKRRAGRKGRRVGRPAGAAGKLGLRNLSLEQLVDVITAAREEVALRIAGFQDLMR